ncbi:MAG: 5-formyltetrahydrofolate cyclo-ligase [Pseudomonadota bacterium]
MIADRQSIRKKMSAQRRSLSDTALRGAMSAIATRAAGFAPLEDANHLGSYVPVRGEISPAVLLENLNPATVSIPMITDYKAGLMRFCYADAAVLSDEVLLNSNDVPRNEFNIPEPIINDHAVDLTRMDAVLVPLVAFDGFGNRLGMGAGFYDRAFEFRRTDKETVKPWLIGLAHDFQQVTQLNNQPWDVPLDAIITPSQIVRIR